MNAIILSSSLHDYGEVNLIYLTYTESETEGFNIVSEKL